MKIVAVVPAAAALGLAVTLAFSHLGAQTPPGSGADYYPFNSRTLNLPIDFPKEKRPSVRQFQVFVSRDQGQTWQLDGNAKNDKESYTFTAKEDGLHWFQLVTVYLDGGRVPADVTRGEDVQKLLIDATPPVVRIPTAERQGDDVVASWTIDDKYPDDSKTRVSYRVAGAAEWKDVPPTGKDPRDAKFNPNSNAAVTIRVVAEDRVGNTTTQTRDVPVLATATPAGFGGTEPIRPIMMPGIAATASETGLVSPMLTTPLPSVPVTPGPAAPVLDLTGGQVPPPALANFAATPAPMPTPAGNALASGSGTATTQPPPVVLQPTAAHAEPPPPPAQLINFDQFDFPVGITAGPSGVKSLDLYVTRDDGKTWVKWSQHDGKDAVVKVSLRSRTGQPIDGTYGFRLVATSGAGLSDETPKPGTPPEFRAQLDTTPPIITIFQPAADPADRGVLVLQWLVEDKNPGTAGVAVEWGDSPAGPWRTVVASAAGNPLTPAGGVTADVTSARVPNTGKYAWKVPANLPSPLVYLRVTAWDGAGNKSEVATKQPIQVDLVKPRATIQGIVPAAAPRP